MDKLIIGKRVRREREKLTMTREKFAGEVGISPRFLGEIESGRKGMSAETLYKICEKVNAPADYILMGRRTAGEAKTPAEVMLSEIPSQYTEMIEDVLKAFLQTIHVAEAKDE